MLLFIMIQCYMIIQERAEEYENTWLELRKIEQKLKYLATLNEVNKYNLHILELEKIVRLLLSLRHCLTPINRDCS